MRTLEQVDCDIEIVRYDMHELMRMRQPISIVGEELVDLYEERNKILKSMGDTK
jgi:chorismate mutase